MEFLPFLGANSALYLGLEFFKSPIFDAIRTIHVILAQVYFLERATYNKILLRKV